MVNRYYVDSPLLLGTQVALEQNEVRHLRVMRKRVGDCIEIINGKGVLAIGKITSLDSQSSWCHLVHTERQNSSSSLILIQALAAFSKLEWIVEKSTELGATKIQLFPADQGQTHTLSNEKLQRLRRITIAAVKQCQRLDVPTIETVPALCKIPRPEGTLFYGDREGNYIEKLTSKPAPYHFCIGPESGFSQKERLYLSHTWKALPIRLHPNVLRTETAAVIATAVLSWKLNCEN